MTAFTRLGSSLWHWAPWAELPPEGRNLWLALYTSAEAKRHAPGLWQGGIPSMAEAALRPPDAVVGALDLLLERELVEYDSKFRVLRLGQLPDAGEYPSNGKVILSWWTRFRSVPECGVRDAHVTTLRWIVDEGGRLSGKGVSVHHESAWRETFATVAIPAPRRRGVRRLADSDTSTQVQPSLFPSVAPGNGIETSGGSVYPQVSHTPVDNSDSLRQMNRINGPETVSDTVSDTNRIPDPGSRIPDHSSLSGERGSGGGHDSSIRPSLSLVPPFTAAQALAALAQGPWDKSLDKAYQDALGALIPRWGGLGVGLAELALLAQYNRHDGRVWNARLLVGCDIEAEIARARQVLDWRDARMSMMGSS